MYKPHPYTFTKKECLRSKDFKGIRWIKKGETIHFMLLTSENGESSKRFGVTMRKKLGGAVVRNRMKRLVREYFRLNKELFTDNLNYLVRIKKAPQKPTWSHANKELGSLLKNM